MLKKMRLYFEDTSLSDLKDVNHSFATGTLKVMYTGDNQNGSSFSQEVVEAALPSIANIPIVAHYDRDLNQIGSHDMELVIKDDVPDLIPLTKPCGVVPERATAEFSAETGPDGARHNYLSISPVILWKREKEVYNHIVNDLGGKVDHSMEINITAYHKDKDSDVLAVDSFEFEALCLLEAARPCFEGSELELFSAREFKSRMEEMMAELRETFAQVNPPEAEIDIDKNDFDTEGGRVLDEKLALLAEFELDAESLDFSLDDFSVEELREKFEAMKGADAGQEPTATFELSGNLRKVLADALGERYVEKPWGPEHAYWFEDYDPEAGMVYACSTVNWNLYGFPFSMNGDAAVIDFDAGKRMKRAFVEFDDGGAEAPETAGMFSTVEAKYAENEKAWVEKYEALSAEREELNAKYEALKESTADVEELRSFKANAEKAAYEAEIEEVFAQFEDLEGNEAFEALRENHEEYDAAALEKECFAIRGMTAVMPAKFSAKEKTPKLKPGKSDYRDEKEPYGGLFREFGPHRD